MIKKYIKKSESGSIAVALIVALLITGTLLFLGKNISEGDSRYYSVSGWPQNIVETYFAECVGDYDTENVKEYCGCNVNQFQSEYKTVEDFDKAFEDPNSSYKKFYQETISKCAEIAGVSIN